MYAEENLMKNLSICDCGLSLPDPWGELLTATPVTASMEYSMSPAGPVAREKGIMKEEFPSEGRSL